MRYQGIAFIVLAVIMPLILLAPPAFAQDDWDDDDWGEEEEFPVEIHGYVEGAGAARIVDDPANSGDFVLGEARFRLDLANGGDRAEFSFKGDFISDAVLDETIIDIRRAWLLLRTGSFDFRVGRQILTWGTGDFLFLNDLFPKDFVSFFIGRDDEFLKAPCNSLKMSGYSNAVNVDVVWTPIFTPDRYITGERLSFYDPNVGDLVSAETMGQPFDAKLPPQTISNSELALRLYRTIGGYEVAAYGYRGFFKQPSAFDPVDSVATFAPLSVYGASARGNLFGGIFNVEGAYYDSREDRDGANPTTRNSQARGLVGYDREWATNFNGGFQYYVEWLQDYDSLIANAPTPAAAPSETFQLVTARLTWRLMQQTLTLSLFAFLSTNGGDSYLRPVVSRRWTDAVTVTAGANILSGSNDSFFGQLENNTNVYLRLRYSF